MSTVLDNCVPALAATGSSPLAWILLAAVVLIAAGIAVIAVRRARGGRSAAVGIGAALVAGLLLVAPVASAPAQAASASSADCADVPLFSLGGVDNCDVAGSLAIPAIEGVEFQRVDHTDGSVTVTAAPALGYRFAAGQQTSWVFAQYPPSDIELEEAEGGLPVSNTGYIWVPQSWTDLYAAGEVEFTLSEMIVDGTLWHWSDRRIEVEVQDVHIDLSGVTLEVGDEYLFMDGLSASIVDLVLQELDMPTGEHYWYLDTESPLFTVTVSTIPAPGTCGVSTEAGVWLMQAVPV